MGKFASDSEQRKRFPLTKKDRISELHGIAWVDHHKFAYLEGHLKKKKYFATIWMNVDLAAEFSFVPECFTEISASIAPAARLPQV